ncbi:MMPL family transporter [Intrasporangium calvum]|uniref:MMPL family transporter n=1 Tax=Intrasporangium calvum TaxID=53358 RepID=UPI000DF61513|nr:MMPL family transporter [Intrasporangium calvum]AXG14222.1 MMPL family transporter [Intrasporangium calvum]
MSLTRTSSSSTPPPAPVAPRAAASAPTGGWTGLISRLTSRRGAWATLLIALVVAAGIIGGLRTEPPVGGGAAGALPASAEAREVADLQTHFASGDQAPALVLWNRADGGPLTPADVSALRAQAPTISASVGAPRLPPTVAEDGRAALLPVPVDVDRTNGQIAVTIAALRQAAAGPPAGLEVHVTGGPALGADVASAFDGADLTLLLVTIAAVVLLLLLTYRSPTLWLVPLTVVALADQVAAVLTAQAGEIWDLRFDAGIISVLVFGAGTNYALLLISRYREELRHQVDHRVALRRAWCSTAGAVVASNVTVVLSLLALLLAALPSTAGLGVAAAIGLLVALAFGLVVLPAALAVTGRGVFWPFVPQPGAPAPGPSLWGRVAGRSMRRPVLTTVVVLGLLAVLASSLFGTRVGLAPTEKFRVATESQVGAERLALHFPSGESAPLVVIADEAAIDRVAGVAGQVDGVVSVHPAGASGGLARLTVTAEAAPGTTEGERTVRALRAAVHSVAGAEAKVGGEAAELLDTRELADRDLRVVVPVILGIVLLVLVALLGAVVGPLVLLTVNALSALAAIGLGSWVGSAALGFAGLDVNVPLLAFMFLVALGVDYTIFLVHRAREEAIEVGTVEGMRRAVGATGTVITSAGVVLAAVFAALGVLPLMVLAQLGLIVGLGVLVDTFVVRTLLVPALFALLGDRMWWPRRP